MQCTWEAYRTLVHTPPPLTHTHTHTHTPAAAAVGSPTSHAARMASSWLSTPRGPAGPQQSRRCVWREAGGRGRGRLAAAAAVGSSSLAGSSRAPRTVASSWGGRATEGSGGEEGRREEGCLSLQCQQVRVCLHAVQPGPHPNTTYMLSNLGPILATHTHPPTHP